MFFSNSRWTDGRADARTLAHHTVLYYWSSELNICCPYQTGWRERDAAQDFRSVCAAIGCTIADKCASLKQILSNEIGEWMRIKEKVREFLDMSHGAIFTG